MAKYTIDYSTLSIISQMYQTLYEIVATVDQVVIDFDLLTHYTEVVVIYNPGRHVSDH